MTFEVVASDRIFLLPAHHRCLGRERISSQRSDACRRVFLWSQTLRHWIKRRKPYAVSGLKSKSGDIKHREDFADRLKFW